MKRGTKEGGEGKVARLFPLALVKAKVDPDVTIFPVILSLMILVTNWTVSVSVCYSPWMICRFC